MRTALMIVRVVLWGTIIFAALAGWHSLTNFEIPVGYWPEERLTERWIYVAGYVLTAIAPAAILLAIERVVAWAQRRLPR